MMQWPRLVQRFPGRSRAAFRSLLGFKGPSWEDGLDSGKRLRCANLPAGPSQPRPCRQTC
eukprot:scaffold1604_cov315-Prasinococcus_capsulatus_cf.AAC.6